jgi:hypothetical protein
VLSFTPVITRVKVDAILTVIRSFELTNGTLYFTTAGLLNL